MVDETSPPGLDEAPVPPAAGVPEPASAVPQMDYKDLYLRARAELDNYRKRSERDRAAYIQLAGEGILRKILEPLDAIDRAIADLEAASRESPDGTKSGLARTLEGLRGVRRLLGDLLASEGVEAVASHRALFDPHVHEALARVPSADTPEGTIVQTLQTGYSMRGRLLRPARVAVSSGPPVAQSQDVPAEPAAPSPAPKARFGRRDPKTANSQASPDGTSHNPSNAEHP